MAKSDFMHAAKKKRDDEWPTPTWMIERVFDKVTTELKGMSVYCPCDGPNSEFTRYFIRNFYKLGLRSLVCTSFFSGGRGTLTRYDHKGYSESLLVGDGDFRSDECRALRDNADIIITNPPWSLVCKQFLLWLQNKDFVFWGNNLAICYTPMRRLFPIHVLGDFIFKRENKSVISFVYSSLDLPKTLREGTFGKTPKKSEGITVPSLDNVVMFNKSCYVPTDVPLGTVFWVPVSCAVMQRLYDTGFEIIDATGYTDKYFGHGGHPFSKIIIKKTREVIL